MSHRFLIGLSVVALAACKPVAPEAPAAPVAPAPAATPAPGAVTVAVADPVAAVIERAEMCVHWGGEEAYDDERRAQIVRGVKDAGCDTVIADAAAVKAAHPEAATRIDAALEPIA